MENFTPINSQEEFDAMIKSRLAREKSALAQQYADYDDLKKKVDGYAVEKKEWDDALAKKDATIKDLTEKMNASSVEVASLKKKDLQREVAMEYGLPMEFASRLSGETAEDIRKDADSLKKLFSINQSHGLPVASREGVMSAESEKKEAYKEMLKKIKKEN